MSVRELKIPKLPHGEGTISIFNDNLLIYKKTIDNSSGKKKRASVYGKTVKECFSNMKIAEKEFEGDAKAPKKTTLYDAMIEWVINKKSMKLSASSYDRLVSTINNQIKPSEIGNIRYQQITHNEIQSFIKALVDKPYSYSVIKKAYDALNDFYRYTTIVDKFDNPMTQVEMPTKSNVKVKIKEIEFFEDDDINKFIYEAKQQKITNNSLKYQWGYAIASNIYLGLRGGELIALKWEDVDFENDTITVNKKIIEIANKDYDESNPELMKKKGVKKTTYLLDDSTKTNQNRFVPMNSKAKELLLAHREHCKFTDPNNFVISTRTQNHTTIKHLSETIQRIEENSETKVQMYGSHVLRHTCASLYFRKGVPVEIIASILGHSVDVCRETYIHLIEEQKKMAASKIATTIKIEL